MTLIFRFVRESIIFAVAATYTAVPFAILFTEMLPDVLDSNEWLQSKMLHTFY